MKTFFALAIMIVTMGSFTLDSVEEGPVNWMNIEEAQQMNLDGANKIVMIDIYTSWCGPCKMMDRNTFTDEKLAAYINEHFLPVKFNGESGDAVNFNGQQFSNPNFDPAKTHTRNSPHQLTRHLGIRGYPTLVFLKPDGTKLSMEVGVRRPNELLSILKKMVAEQ